MNATVTTFYAHQEETEKTVRCATVSEFRTLRRKYQEKAEAGLGPEVESVAVIWGTWFESFENSDYGYQRY
jgi:hypothetical protein